MAEEDMGGMLWGRGEFGGQAKLELGKGTTMLIVMNAGAQQRHCRAPKSPCSICRVRYRG